MKVHIFDSIIEFFVHFSVISDHLTMIYFRYIECLHAAGNQIALRERAKARSVNLSIKKRN